MEDASATIAAVATIQVPSSHVTSAAFRRAQRGDVAHESPNHDFRASVHGCSDVLLQPLAEKPNRQSSEKLKETNLSGLVSSR